MRNPLSDLEKKIIVQHLNHDMRSALNNLYCIFIKGGAAIDNEWGKSNVLHLKNSISALEQLTADTMRLETVTSSDIQTRVAQNKAAVRRRNDHFIINTYQLTSFKTHIDVLGLCIYTLMGNSAMQVAHGQGTITVTASDYTGTPMNLVYQNPLAPTVGEFKRFRIQDTGQGFAYGTKFLVDEEKSEAKDSSPHFGLRLTRMICKHLMSHFAIVPKTDPTDTSGADVSIYHPADSEPLYKK